MPKDKPESEQRGEAPPMARVGSKWTDAEGVVRKLSRTNEWEVVGKTDDVATRIARSEQRGEAMTPEERARKALKGCYYRSEEIASCAAAIESAVSERDEHLRQEALHYQHCPSDDQECNRCMKFLVWMTDPFGKPQ